MNHARANQRVSCTLLWWFMRGFWTCLAAIHLWPLASLTARLLTAPSVSVGLWLAAVVAVTGLFALKAVDFSMLRMRQSWLEFTAFVIVTALIHGDAVSAWNTPALAVETVTAVVAVSGGAALTRSQIRRRFAQWMSDLARRLLMRLVRRPIGLAPLAACLRADQVWRRCMPARAPPLPAP